MPSAPAVGVNRWSTVAAYAAVAAATQLLWLTYAPITTATAEHFGVSEGAVGWLANVFPLFYVVLAIPAGIVLDRWFVGGLRAGAVLTAAGGCLRLLGDGYAWAMAGQVLIAVAQPLVLNAITGVAGRYLHPSGRPSGIAVGTASTFAGLVLAFALGTVLPDSSQLQVLLTIQAGFAVLAAGWLVLATRHPGDFHQPRLATGFRAVSTAWADRGLRRLCALVFLPFGAFIALSTWTQALLEPAGVSSENAGILLIVNVVVGVAGCAVVPVWAARRRREASTLGVAVLATAVCCLLLAVAPSLALGFVAFAVIGFLLLPALPIVLELSERRQGAGEGTAAGLIWLSGNAGGLVVAALVGALVDHPAVAFGVLAVLMVLPLPLVRGLARAERVA